MASITRRYKVVDGGRGYDAQHPPSVRVETPAYLQDTARAVTLLKRSGSVFRVALKTPGKGYEGTPAVRITPPR